MNRITVDQQLTTQLEGIAVPVEMVDQSGRPLGHFVPRLATATPDECPYAAAELDAMCAERGGRGLAEIWRSLGPK